MNLFFAALLSACMGVTAAQSSPTVDDIVNAHIAALGGIEKIHAIHSFVLHGTYHEGELSMKTTVTQMRPFYRVIGNAPSSPSRSIRNSPSPSSRRLSGTARRSSR